MHYSNDLSCRSFWKLHGFTIAVLLLFSSLAWSEGNDVAGVAVKTEAAVVLASGSATEEPERKMFNDEAREMPGIVFGSIVVNSILVTVFFWLLWKEWKKHGKRKPKPESELSGEGEEL